MSTEANDNKHFLFTSESVGEGHPGNLCCFYVSVWSHVLDLVQLFFNDVSSFMKLQRESRQIREKSVELTFELINKFIHLDLLKKQPSRLFLRNWSFCRYCQILEIPKKEYL